MSRLRRFDARTLRPRIVDFRNPICALTVALSSFYIFFYPRHNSFVQYIVLLSLTGLSEIHLFCAILDRYVFHARIKHKHLSLYSCSWLNESRLRQKLHINYVFDFIINYIVNYF